MKYFWLLVVLVGVCVGQESALPGWTISINGNFLNLSNVPTNNGYATVETIRVANKWALRADQLVLANPEGGLINLGKVEYRRLLSDFVKPNGYVNTANFELFANAGGGVAKSHADSPFEVNDNRPAWTIGGGFDIALGGSSMFTLRPLDISYVRASILQGGGQLIGNHLQLLTGVGIRFGSVAQMTKNRSMKAEVKAKYYPQSQ